MEDIHFGRGAKFGARTSREAISRLHYYRMAAGGAIIEKR